MSSLSNHINNNNNNVSNTTYCSLNQIMDNCYESPKGTLSTKNINQSRSCESSRLYSEYMVNVYKYLEQNYNYKIKIYSKSEIKTYKDDKDSRLSQEGIKLFFPNISYQLSRNISCIDIKPNLNKRDYLDNESNTKQRYSPIEKCRFGSKRDSIVFEDNNHNSHLKLNLSNEDLYNPINGINSIKNDILKSEKCQNSNFDSICLETKDSQRYHIKSNEINPESLIIPQAKSSEIISILLSQISGSDLSWKNGKISYSEWESSDQNPNNAIPALAKPDQGYSNVMNMISDFESSMWTLSDSTIQTPTREGCLLPITDEIVYFIPNHSDNDSVNSLNKAKLDIKVEKSGGCPIDNDCDNGDAIINDEETSTSLSHKSKLLNYSLISNESAFELDDKDKEEGKGTFIQMENSSCIKDHNQYSLISQHHNANLNGKILLRTTPYHILKDRKNTNGIIKDGILESKKRKLEVFQEDQNAFRLSIDKNLDNANQEYHSGTNINDDIIRNIKKLKQ